jgi:hypothetical protein
MPVFSYVATDGSEALGVTLPDNSLSARFDNVGRKRVGTTTAPTVVAGAGAGASATATLVGTDEVGLVSIGTGASGTGAGILATVTFAVAYAKAPVAVVSPGDVVGATKTIYATTTTTTLVIRAAADPTATQALKVYYSLVGGA